MLNRVLYTALCFLLNSLVLFSGDHRNSNVTNNSLLTSNNIFFQSGNIHTVFRNDGYFNYDKITLPSGSGGLIWPAAASQNSTTIFTSGIWIGAKMIMGANQKELRLAASMYSSHYSPGNIPVTGSVPPVSVCNDSSFNGYLVSCTDQSLVNGGVRMRIAGGRTYTFTYSPWSAWPISLGAPYVEVNGTPGYQPGWDADRPGIGFGAARPTEMLFIEFMDYTNCSNDIHESELSLPGGTAPLGVEVQQLAYAFQEAGLLNSFFVRYKIINKSGKTWDSTYVGLVNDGDIGNANDDAVGCDSLLNIAYTSNADNDDPEYGAAPPAAGYTLIQGPLVHTGVLTDTAKLPCNTLVGYKMKYLSGHISFDNGGGTCNGDPDDAVNAYNFLLGKDGCGNTIINPITGKPTTFMYSSNHCIGAGWYDSSSVDKRNLINTGPFTMNTGDTQVIVYAYNIERGSTNLQSVCQVIANASYLKQQYYNCFNLIGINQLSNNVPERFTLEQNFPNPFNPVTNIKFSINQKAFTKLTVFDALGREVKVLLSMELQTGTYNVDWDASAYPSGVYFYRLESGDFNETKKMVLVK